MSYAQTAYTQPRGYRDPVQLSIAGNLGRSASTLQNNYNQNYRTIIRVVDRIGKEIDRLRIPQEQKNEIYRRFNNGPIATLNKVGVNYSSDSHTDAAINFLYDSLNDIIDDVTN